MTNAVVQAADLDADVIEMGEELVHRPAGTLFRTDDPAEVLARATAVADVLKPALRASKLITRISGREHVGVDGWTLTGSMIGVLPTVEWSRPVQDGWEARVVARTLDGRIVGAAEAQCTRSERLWANRDDFAIRSMAQTRAVSKALRGPLGFVVHLAGYASTPAEELEPDAPAPPPTWAQAATPARVDVLRAELASIGLADETVQSLIGAWGSAFGLIPDLIVGVARGISRGIAHQNITAPEPQENPA